MESNARTTSSTAGPHASGDDEPWLPKIPGPRQPSGLTARPPLPRRTIPATARALARELAAQGWEQAA